MKVSRSTLNVFFFQTKKSYCSEFKIHCLYDNNLDGNIVIVDNEKNNNKTLYSVINQSTKHH